MKNFPDQSTQTMGYSPHCPRGQLGGRRKCCGPWSDSAMICCDESICFNLRHCPKNRLPAGSEQVADDTRQLDLTFFQSF